MNNFADFVPSSSIFDQSSSFGSALQCDLGPVPTSTESSEGS